MYTVMQCQIMAMAIAGRLHATVTRELGPSYTQCQLLTREQVSTRDCHVHAQTVSH